MDDSWTRGLDMDSPSEFHYGRLDVLPQSATGTDVSHWDVGEGDGWEQFHAEWLRDDAVKPCSPIISSNT